MRHQNPVSTSFTLLFLALAAPVAHAQSPTAPAADQFQVNESTTGGQSPSTVASTPDGNFVVVFQSYAPAGDGSETGVFARRFAADGSALGDDFQINTYTTDFQTESEIAVANDGSFVVTWRSFASGGADTSGSSIQARLFDSGGSPVGADFEVNSYTAGDQLLPAVALDGDGNFVVVWESVGSVGGTSVQARRFSADGVSLDGQFQLNTVTGGSQYEPRIARRADGDFVVVWSSQTSAGTDTDDRSVQARRFLADGSPIGDEFQVNESTTGSQAWPDVALAEDGSFVVVWNSDVSAGDDASGSSVQARRIDAAGIPIGGEFQINALTAEYQFNAKVGLVPDGGFVVSWVDNGGNGDDTQPFGILARRFADDGAALGVDFSVNTYTTGEQLGPDIAVDAFGDFVLTWSSIGSFGDDSSASSVQARQYRVTADAGDLVWLDLDADGLQDAGEPGVGGVAVSLHDAATDELLDQATTASDGSFALKTLVGLPGGPEEFYLAFDAPGDTIFTAMGAGADGTVDSDVDPATGRTAIFLLLDAGTANFDLDAGLVVTEPIFEDGFESGNTSAWSTVVP